MVSGHYIIFSGHVIDEHLKRYDNIEASTRLTSWLATHLRKHMSEEKHFEQAGNFLVEKIGEIETHEAFEKFLDGFGQPEESWKKFQEALKKRYVPAIAPAVVPKAFVELAEKIAAILKLKERNVDLALVLKAANDAFGNENLRTFAKKALPRVLSKNPAWNAEDLAKKIGALKEHFHRVELKNKEEQENEFERVIGPVLHAMLRKSDAVDEPKKLEGTIGFVRLLARKGEKEYKTDYFYNMFSHER